MASDNKMVLFHVCSHISLESLLLACLSWLVMFVDECLIRTGIIMMDQAVTVEIAGV